jgi:hypothetical protein
MNICIWSSSDWSL